jgi:DNA end-binding protein Ku
VPANGIPFVYLERPYYVAPINRGAKVYALLRETLQRSGRVGVARVVIQTKQHLAVLVPVGPGLVLNLLRWGADIRPWKDLPLPSEDAKKAGLTERELKMARQLVEDMSGEWDPMEFKDEFKDEILRLVDRKVKAGQTETVTQPEPEEGQSSESKGAKIIDLTELLQRSLRNKGGAKAKAADDEEDEEEPASRAKPAAKKHKPAAKTASKTKARRRHAA